MDGSFPLADLVALREAIRSSLLAADAAGLVDVGLGLEAAYLAADRRVVECGGDSLPPPQPPELG